MHARVSHHSGSLIEVLLITGDCEIGTFKQRVNLTPDTGVLDISTRLRLKDGISVHSCEDLYDFPRPRHIDRLRYF